MRALVGNADFFDDDHGGQIPAFDVPRSPGSTLKPFIYGLAIDDGLALPRASRARRTVVVRGTTGRATTTATSPA